jgi:anti-sigma factor RsiW
MTCKFDEMLLHEYLDQTLDDDDKLTVERHLSACPECRKKLSEIKLLYFELDNLDDISVPSEVDSIRASIVSNAFENAKVPLTQRVKDTKKALEETPVIGALVPTKAKMKSAAKGLYKGTKKAVEKLPKKEEKKKTRRSLGGLL